MTPTTEAGKVLADWLTFAAKRVDGVPTPDAVAEVEAEARSAALRDLRAKVEGLDMPWATPKGRFLCSVHVDRAAVLALIDRALEP